MTNDVLIGKEDKDFIYYEDKIDIRGCHLTLNQVKLVYRELQRVNSIEGVRLVSQLKPADSENEESFSKRKEFLVDNAFRLTVTVIGSDGQSVYGEFESVFDSQDLPLPIKKIFFTNVNSFRRNADGDEPRNRFSIWLDFEKPPLFDPNPLLSDQTPNDSKAEVKAEDITYFRAVQRIIHEKIIANRKWYSFLHARFAYDLGFWFLALPYSLYWISIYSTILNTDSRFGIFVVSYYIYSIGMSALLYRSLFGYVKWALPVNILEENRDRSTPHRIALLGIVSGLFYSLINSAIEYLPGF